MLCHFIKTDRTLARVQISLSMHTQRLEMTRNNIYRVGITAFYFVIFVHLCQADNETVQCYFNVSNAAIIACLIYTLDYSFLMKPICSLACHLKQHKINAKCFKDNSDNNYDQHATRKAIKIMAWKQTTCDQFYTEKNKHGISITTLNNDHNHPITN